MFQWEETVQLQCIKIAQAYAGHFQTEAGAEGAVDLVTRALEALPESLPCAITGIRALGVMVSFRPNLVRAKLAGVEDAVSGAVEIFQRDGELQFRASQLAATLAAISEEEAESEVSSATGFQCLKRYALTDLSDHLLPRRCRGCKCAW
jgi:hypothetical protein